MILPLILIPNGDLPILESKWRLWGFPSLFSSCLVRFLLDFISTRSAERGFVRLIFPSARQAVYFSRFCREGCLSRVDGQWVLLNSSLVVVVRDSSASGPAQKRARGSNFRSIPSGSIYLSQFLKPSSLRGGVMLSSVFFLLICFAYSFQLC